MALLTREQLAKPIPFKMTEVDVSEWGEINPETGEHEKTTVFVRELSARERDEFEESLWRGKGAKKEIQLRDARVRMAILSCCMPDGTRIFQPEDVEWLRNKPVKPLSRIHEAANKLNGFTDEDEEELLKNSPRTSGFCSGIN